MDCDSAVLKKVKKISMTCNVLLLHFTHTKIQMLTTSSWIVTILLKSLCFQKCHTLFFKIIKPHWLVVCTA